MSTANATAATAPTPAVTEPFPIFQLAHRFLLYDVNVVTHVRKEYNITGVLVGTMPQAPQQNVFLGLPLELMPEEARLLVSKGVAFITDDTADHKRNFLGNGLSDEERRAYQNALRAQGETAAVAAGKRSDERKAAAMKKHGVSAGDATENWNDLPDDMYTPGPRRRVKKKPSRAVLSAVSTEAGPDEDSLFAPSTSDPVPVPVHSPTSTVASESVHLQPDVEPYGVTPTTSYPPLAPPKPGSEASILPPVPASYPLYKHLHDQGYFLAPGLRFGCQYMAYPGDPLRFHSHFLCNGMGWDDEFDLMDIVAGGRLGTGVKKGFLVGGEELSKAGNAAVTNAGSIRTFCVEWGGM